MRSITFFLIGNFFLVLISILHLIGFFLGTPEATSQTEKDFFYLLLHLEVNMMGMMRTYSDIISGYSLTFAATTFFIAAYNLSFTKFLREQKGVYRNVLLVNILLWGTVFTIFFFYMIWPPIILSGICLIIFLFAYYFSIKILPHRIK